jgi:hypothetical protein
MSRDMNAFDAQALSTPEAALAPVLVEIGDVRLRYAGAVAALAAGTLPASVPGRRSVRRDGTADSVAESDENSFADSSSTQTGQRRRRPPVGTLNR